MDADWWDTWHSAQHANLWKMPVMILAATENIAGAATSTKSYIPQVTAHQYNKWDYSKPQTLHYYKWKRN